MEMSSRMRMVLFAACFFSLAGTAIAGVNVTTYHNDNQRTGWNANETKLTPQTVAGGSFKRIKTVTLDEQVDAQPLVIRGQTISGSTHTVAYVATENNTIYAIDPDGKILLQRNLGSPVPEADLPGGCNNNGPFIGIDSTPVIDANSGILYVIADTLNSGNATYTLHALSLSTLADVKTPVVVSAKGKLIDGAQYHFDANVSRLRSALLLSRGNVYAGFASYCDESANQSRGWVLGWNASTLMPLASNELTDKRGGSEDSFFLSSIWMSGYGLAADWEGDVFFVTGNTDYDGTSFNAVENIAESAVSVSSDLSTVNSLFTPSDWSSLDMDDSDFGSGGLMVLPHQTGSAAKLAVAAGKDGNLYLLRSDGLNKLYGTYQIGGCWCGESYFAVDGSGGRVVTSGGTNVGIWAVDVSGKPKLDQLNQSSTSVNDGQDPGFFTSVSSNGTEANSQVIWAVSRPINSSPANVDLYAFDSQANLLFSGKAGSWPNTGGNANIVPTVANGYVYIASNKTLSIFGLSKNAAAELPKIAAQPSRPVLAPGVHEIYGTILGVDGALITVRMRDGQSLKVDSSQAMRERHYAAPKTGRALMALGVYVSSGAFKAEYVFHAKPNPAIWMADR